MGDDLSADAGSVVSAALGRAGAECSALEVAPEDSASQDSGNEDEVNGRARGKGKGKAKAKGKPKAKAKGKAKGQGRGALNAGFADCELCQGEFRLEEMAANSNKCQECKLDWDSLGRMAKRQDLDAWWVAVQQKNIAYKRTVWKAFKGRFRALKTIKEKREFKMMEFIESFKFVSATDLERTGKMMWLEEALEYWQSTPGGRYSKAEAQQMWDDLLRDPEHLEDEGGPRHSPKQLYVSTGTTIKKRATVERGREMKLSASKKKYTEDDLRKTKRACTAASHEDIAGLTDADVSGSGNRHAYQSLLECGVQG